MNMQNEICNDVAETNAIEDYYIKKDLINVGSMANIISKGITTAYFETYELILNCVASLTATALAYFWLLKHTKTPFASMRPSKEKQGKHMLKYICICESRAPITRYDAYRLYHEDPRGR